MYIAVVCQLGCDVISFEINLIFLIKLFFLYDEKIQDKNWNILRTKRVFKVKQKTFFTSFKGLLLKQIRLFFGKLESNFNIFK